MRQRTCPTVSVHASGSRLDAFLEPHGRPLLFPSTCLAILAGALTLEALLGYPQALFRAIGHPVTWIGRVLSWFEHRLNRPSLPPRSRRLGGVLALAGVLATAVLPTAALQAGLHASFAGSLLLVLLAASLPAQRSLRDHVRAVAEALERDGLAAGRRSVSRIVGRDPESLDEAGVVRAAIESLAENFSDGVVAPAVWGALLGLPGMAGYKAVNTADSMVGHRTPRHEAFGWAAARLDDWVNLPASRLTALLILGAAALQPGADARAAWRALRRDARRHRSPNAGWPEAAMAGALGLRLAGPRRYGGAVVEDAWMGDGRAAATAADLRRALRLYSAARGLGYAIVLLALGLSWRS